MLIRKIYFFLILGPWFWTQVKENSILESPFYQTFEQLLITKKFHTFSPFLNDFFQKIPLKKFNMEETVSLQIGDSLLVPNLDFRPFLLQKAKQIQSKELYFIKSSFLKKPLSFPVDQRIFVLFLPVAENTSLTDNDYLVNVLNLWRDFDKNENAILLLAQDFSQTQNWKKESISLEILNTGDDFDDRLGGNVLLVDQKLIIELLQKQNSTLKILEKSTPIQKIPIEVNLSIKKLTDLEAYNFLLYLPANDPKAPLLVVSTEHNDEILALLPTLELNVLPIVFRYWLELALNIQDLWKDKKKRNKNILFVSFSKHSNLDYGFSYYQLAMKKWHQSAWLQLHLEDKVCTNHPFKLHANNLDESLFSYPYLNALKKKEKLLFTQELCVENSVLQQTDAPLIFYPINHQSDFNEPLRKAIFSNIIHLMEESSKNN